MTIFRVVYISQSDFYNLLDNRRKADVSATVRKMNGKYGKNIRANMLAIRLNKKFERYEYVIVNHSPVCIGTERIKSILSKDDMNHRQ